jgi:hypothetical protein
MRAEEHQHWPVSGEASPVQGTLPNQHARPSGLPAKPGPEGSAVALKLTEVCALPHHVLLHTTIKPVPHHRHLPAIHIVQTLTQHE